MKVKRSIQWKKKRVRESGCNKSRRVQLTVRGGNYFDAQRADFKFDRQNRLVEVTSPLAQRIRV